MTAIEVAGVRKSFRTPFRLCRPFRPRRTVRALDGVDLTVLSGSVFALLGPNGAGKTTLLKILSTLVLPDQGRVRVNGHGLEQDAAIRASVSFAMGDERSFYRRLTGRQNLEFFGALYGLSRGELRKKLAELTPVFGLADLLDRRYQALSTGNRHRLLLARSFLNDAAILLADEPTRSLDPGGKAELQGLLRRLASEFGKTVLFTTHDLEEAARTGDRIGVLHGGRLPATGTVEQLLAQTGTRSLGEAYQALCGTEGAGDAG